MKLLNNAPIKYHVGAHRLCASYPTETDVIYDMIEYVLSSNKRKKTWKPDDMQLKLSAVKDVFPNIGDADFKEKIKTILTSLHKNNDIAITSGAEEDSAVIAITSQGISKLYDI